MRKDLYPFSIIPRDAAPRARSTQTFSATTEGVAFDHAAPPALVGEAGIPPAQQPHGSTDPAVHLDAAQG
jgi:hypothetical protein